MANFTPNINRRAIRKRRPPRAEGVARTRCGAVRLLPNRANLERPALLNANPKPGDAEIEESMNGNICRCATYVRIKAAITTAAAS